MEKTYKLPTVTPGQFTNPLPYRDGGRRTNPDPFILPYCGRYYCYASDAEGVRISVSDDLVHWEELAMALDMPGHKNFWAPGVLYDNGRFYMYYSCEPEGAEGDHWQHLRLAVAEKPEGPFVYRKTFFEKFSIDAHPVRWNGEVYLFYSANDVTARDEHFAGTSILVDRLVDMETLAGEAKPVVTPSIPQEIYEKNRFGDGRDWYTIEGACFLQHGDTCYLMYSANAYVNVDYFVGVATAKAKPNLMDMEWEKYPDPYTWHPLILKNGDVEGTGHNTTAKAPNLVDDWLVYHGRSAHEAIVPGTEQREMRIDPLFINGGELMTNGPSHLPQDLPAAPTLAKGEARLEHGSLLYQNSATAFVLQAWLAAQPSNDGARYGAYLYHKADNEYLKAEIHSGLDEIRLVRARGGVVSVLARQRLPKGFNHFVPHRIDAVFRLGEYRVWLDEWECLAAIGPVEAGGVGVFTGYNPLTLFYFAKTDACILRDADLAGLGTRLACLEPLTFEQGRLVPTEGRAVRLQKQWLFTGHSVEEFNLCPLGREGEVTLTLAGKTLLHLQDMARPFTVRLTRYGSSLWLWANGAVSGPVTLNESGPTLELDARNLALEGYSSIENG